MSNKTDLKIPVGTKALIMSKLYYGVLSKSLESLDIDRYFSVLYFLSSNNGCRQQYICDHLAVDKTAMVKVIDTLIKAGYIEKKINPQDRREHFVFLSKKGVKYSAKVVDAFNAIDREIFKGISKQDAETFDRVLHKLSRSLLELPSNDLFFNYKKTTKNPGKTKSTKA